MEMEKEITGVMVYYCVVCKRKLWYFSRHIDMEHTNENVEIGRLIDEEFYKKDEKHINIDNVINIDFIKSRNILHEVKKSRKIEEAGVMQVKYYLYYLRQRGVELRAQIDYPLLKQTMEVALDDGDVRKIEDMLTEIKDIVNRDIPPKHEKSKICKSCAYFDLCYI